MLVKEGTLARGVSLFVLFSAPEKMDITPYRGTDGAARGKLNSLDNPES